MNYIHLLMGVVLGYCLWNIVYILRTDKKMHKFNTVMDRLTGDMNKMESKEDDPIVTVHHTLTKLLNFPESKAILYNNDTAVAVAYGHSCVVIINRPDTSAIGIGIGVDKTTKQTKEERDQEFQELKQLLESCDFKDDNFSDSLASLVTKVAHADSTKFTHIHRQIPRDML